VAGVVVAVVVAAAAAADAVAVVCRAAAAARAVAVVCRAVVAGIVVAAIVVAPVARLPCHVHLPDDPRPSTVPVAATSPVVGLPTETCRRPVVPVGAISPAAPGVRVQTSAIGRTSVADPMSVAPISAIVQSLVRDPADCRPAAVAQRIAICRTSSTSLREERVGRRLVRSAQEWD
jgi:hypothetical protein